MLSLFFNGYFLLRIPFYWAHFETLHFNLMKNKHYLRLCIRKKPHSAIKEGSDIGSRKVVSIMLLKILSYCTVDLIMLYMYLDNNCMHVEINNILFT